MSDYSRNAPELIIKGEKWEVNNESRISVADRLIKAIGTNKQLKANDRLLLIILLGQAIEGFHPSEQWVLDRTGMSHKTYLECKKRLQQLKIIRCEDYKSIIVNIDAIEFPEDYQ